MSRFIVIKVFGPNGAFAGYLRNGGLTPELSKGTHHASPSSLQRGIGAAERRFPGHRFVPVDWETGAVVRVADVNGTRRHMRELYNRLAVALGCSAPNETLLEMAVERIEQCIADEAAKKTAGQVQ